MSDYRNSEFDYQNDPLRREPAYDPDARAMNATWGWIAAAVFIVVVLAVAFGIGHEHISMKSKAKKVKTDKRQFCDTSFEIAGVTSICRHRCGRRKLLLIDCEAGHGFYL